MARRGAKVKLEYGSATRIAKKVKVSVAHVTLVLKGERKPGPRLARAIQREVEKQQQSTAAA